MRIATSPPIGLSAIAIGSLTEITEIIAPASANAGDQVNVEVRVINISTETIAISCATGLYNGSPLNFSPDYLWANPGSIQSFTASFTMPTQGIRLHVGSFYWTGAEWIQDDYGYVDIALAAPPEEGAVQIESVNTYVVR